MRERADIAHRHLRAQRPRPRPRGARGGRAAATRTRCAIYVVSFGFKYGIPLDADHVVDVRFLANPYWITELRHLTGPRRAGARLRARPARARASSSTGTSTRSSRCSPGYLHEEKRYVTIAVGCTGGKHRSVAISEAIAAPAARAGAARRRDRTATSARSEARAA